MEYTVLEVRTILGEVVTDIYIRIKNEVTVLPISGWYHMQVSNDVPVVAAISHALRTGEYLSDKWDRSEPPTESRGEIIDGAIDELRKLPAHHFDPLVSRLVATLNALR